MQNFLIPCLHLLPVLDSSLQYRVGRSSKHYQMNTGSTGMSSKEKSEKNKIKHRKDVNRVVQLRGALDIAKHPSFMPCMIREAVTFLRY